MSVRIERQGDLAILRLDKERGNAIDEALGWDDPSNVYVCASRYASQLDHYRDAFPKSHLLVLEQSDLLNQRRETVRFVLLQRTLRSSHSPKTLPRKAS